VAEAAAEFNFGTMPLFCISDRHYLKVLVKCENNAVKADESVAQFGYVSYCNSCTWRTSGKRATYTCERCGKATEIGGQLWLGETSDKAFVKKMAALNNKRNYANKKEIINVLSKVEAEHGLPIGYFDIHRMCKRLGTGSVPKFDLVLALLTKRGFKAMRPHYSDTALKTDAKIDDVEKAVKAAIKK
jgi:tRNA (guanine26-N2/guanine27-N2)-dimethyltransferase